MRKATVFHSAPTVIQSMNHFSKVFLIFSLGRWVASTSSSFSATD